MQLLISAGASLAATAFPFFCTCLGAGLVCALRPGSEDAAGHRAVQGFAAGVMLAASVFSLLLPAAELAAEAGFPGWLAACGGFGLGAGLFLGLDLWFAAPAGQGLSEWAIALHNLPEGMAVGLAAAAAALSGVGLWAGAGAIAFGVGIQNIPEAAAKPWLRGYCREPWSLWAAWLPHCWRGWPLRPCPGCWPLPPEPWSMRRYPS